MGFQTSLVLFIPPFSSLLYFSPYPSPVQVLPHCLFSHFHLRSTCSLLFSPLASPSTTVCFYFLFPVVTLGYRFTPENFELESTNKKEHVAFVFCIWVIILRIILSSSIHLLVNFMILCIYVPYKSQL